MLPLEIKNTEHKTSLENEKPRLVWEISRLRFWQDFQRANSLWECLAVCGGCGGGVESHWINTYIRDEHIKQLIIYRGYFFNEAKKLITYQTPFNYLLPWFIFMTPNMSDKQDLIPDLLFFLLLILLRDSFTINFKNQHSIYLFPAPELQLPARDDHLAWASQPNQSKDKLTFPLLFNWYFLQMFPISLNRHLKLRLRLSLAHSVLE